MRCCPVISEPFKYVSQRQTSVKMQFHIKNVFYNYLKKRKRNNNRYLRSCSSWLRHLFLCAVLWVVDKSWSRSLRFLICDKLLLTALQQYKQRLICCRSNKFLWIREESSLDRFTPSLALVLYSFSLLTSLLLSEELHSNIRTSKIEDYRYFP